MRLRFLVALVVTAIGTIVACGGSEGGSLVATSVPTAPTGRTPAPTSAPSTTVVPTQPPVTGTGTALDKAINVPLKEEDNVRYGSIHRYSSTRMVAMSTPSTTIQQPYRGNGNGFMKSWWAGSLMITTLSPI